MNKNLKLLVLGLVVFLFSFMLRMQNIISETINNVLVIISLIIIAFPLSRMVFKRQKK